MSLSYTGNSCFDTPVVKGYNRVPLPPAKIIPFITISLKYCILEKRLYLVPQMQTNSKQKANTMYLIHSQLQF
jgi:hypothetical protein